MNQVDFSNPNGFPLEADVTLGFMQSDYQGAINGLAKFFGEAVIVSGMDEAGSNVSNGWIVLNGELIFFEGGAKTTNYVIQSTWVSKANQDGQTFQRYLTKKARFGSGGTSYPYANLVRLQGIQSLQNRLLDAFTFESEVIVSGCAVSAVNTGASTLTIAAGAAIINRKFITVSAYSGDYPVFLNESGAWVNTQPVANYIKFDPYTSQYWKDVCKRGTTPSGEVLMLASAPGDRFDNTGLGKWERKGFALCNGANGTVDLRSRFVVGHDPRNTDPGGNLWDSAYNTVGATGGEKAHTLTIGEIPSHNHGAGSGSGFAKVSVVGENTTATNHDSAGSGSEPDIKNQPVAFQSQGGGNAHENRPPFLVLAYIQRI